MPRPFGGPSPVKADLALRERAVVTRIQTPVVLLEHAPIADLHGAAAMNRHDRSGVSKFGRVLDDGTPLLRAAELRAVLSGPKTQRAIPDVREVVLCLGSRPMFVFKAAV